VLHVLRQDNINMDEIFACSGMLRNVDLVITDQSCLTSHDGGENLKSRINVDLKVSLVWKCETDSYG